MLCIQTSSLLQYKNHPERISKFNGVIVVKEETTVAGQCVATE